MSRYVLPGSLGLLVGLLLHWAGFSRQEGTTRALGLRRSLPLCSGLTAVGWALVMTALLGWLAVIDVDTIEVLPLSLGTLAGGVVFGIAAGLTGFTPSTAFAGLGAGNALEALSTLAGCALTALLLPSLEHLLAPLREAAPYVAATLFQVTLDEPYLLGGGFAGQGAVGGIIIAAAMMMGILNSKFLILNSDGGTEVPDAAASLGGEESAPDAAADTAESTDAPDAADTPVAPDSSDAPADAAGDTFIALLPGEEPLVIDTDTESPDPDESPDESSTPDPKPTN